MDAIYFILRYIPWWAVPSLVICAQFAHTFWIKDIRRLVYIFVAGAGVNGVFILYYLWAGSPDRSVRYFKVFLDKL